LRFAGILEKEREKKSEKGRGFQVLSIALICSLVSVEGFNFPGTTKSVFLFRRFSHRRHPKEGGFQHPDVSLLWLSPSHAFVLDLFFFRALVIDSTFLFPFSPPVPTRLSGAVWMDDRFEAIRLFRRNEFTPKKKWARWGTRRSMAYCAVSHVVWLFGWGGSTEEAAWFTSRWVYLTFAAA